jgi:hypothetical protein
MDPISSSTAGVVSPTATSTDTAQKIQKLAEELKKIDVTTPEGSRRMMEINRQLMIFAGAPAAASASDIPEPPAGPPDTALGQEVLDRAFSKMQELEDEMKKIDPTTPEGSKRMMEINRQLNRIDEMIRMVSEMRRSRHEANMAAINNIA